MNSNHRITSSLITVIAVLFSLSALAQVTSSPYSRYGVGDVGGKGYAQNMAIGGTCIALSNDTVPIFFINNGNPASYTNMKLTTAELGVNYTRNQLENSEQKHSINSASLGYISLAFPIKKWWGSSIGLLPYSAVGYKVSDQAEISNVGTVKYLYQGSGGLNQVYFGNAIKPLYGLPRNYLLSSTYATLASRKNSDGTPKDCKQLYHDNNIIRKAMNRRKFLQSASFGANASYLFGDVTHERRSILPSSLLAFNTRTGTDTRIDGLYLDYGFQVAYEIDSVAEKNYADTSKTKLNECRPLKYRVLDDKVKILFGATFSSESRLNATIDSLSYSYFNNSLGYEIVKDTIENSKNNHGKVTLPMSFGFGIGFKKGYKWLVAADVAIQNWSDYQAFGQSQGLRNSLRTSIGAQWVPSSKFNAKYYERMHYRLGVRYMQTALELKETPLSEYALSFGIGFPVGRSLILQSFSMVNLSVEMGRRGTTTNGLIRENFLKATIGFTINDRWFQKPKFD
ncbi:MAG: hypothetical protein ACJ77K_14675 [Bacteroidia bacterium]